MKMFDEPAKPSMQHRFATVTPEMAAEILSTMNRENRRYRPAVANKYAAMMKAGLWPLSPEPIVISSTNRLLNGQHRLSAVVISGVPVQFCVVTGAPDEVFHVLDRGATRTAADALGIDRQGAEAAALLANALRPSFSGSGISDMDIKDAFAIIGDVHGQLMDFCGTRRKVFSSASFRLACVARVIGGANRQDAFSLYRDMVLGNTDMLPPVGHAVMKMHISGRLSEIKGGSGGTAQMKLLALAWAMFDPNRRMAKRLTIAQPSQLAAELREATGYGA